MAKDSKIEWTHHTANLWHGCTKVHEGCDHCYAEALAKRWGHNVWGNDKPRKAIKSVWDDLQKYQKLAQDAGEIHKVFVGSMMDIFEKPMPLIDSKGNELPYNTDVLRQKFFNEVIPQSPNLLFLLLTKRPSNINKFIPDDWKVNPPKNVMFGTSPVNQQTANSLIEHLQRVNGRKFLSVEPQISEITLMQWLSEKEIEWVIQGGESGHHKRPFNTDWARKLMSECAATNTPYFFKQIDKVQEIPDDLLIRQFPKSVNKYSYVSKQSFQEPVYHKHRICIKGTII
jgi:protein gp37